ncbi:unnamed protein product [Strongylus vulgaris]|uniref:Uncharacterized protein n=1 Tax=Strongylus vulgaris TaxID=40348 RepID=A0A3P7M238_STRVU|nr:unnamed protein product [Strongylus vulgaris]
MKRIVATVAEFVEASGEACGLTLSPVAVHDEVKEGHDQMDPKRPRLDEEISAEPELYGRFV